MQYKCYSNKRNTIIRAQCVYPYIVEQFTLSLLQGGKKNKTTPNFGGHFDLLPEKNYNPFSDAI